MTVSKQLSNPPASTTAVFEYGGHHDPVILEKRLTTLEATITARHSMASIGVAVLGLFIGVGALIVSVIMAISQASGGG
ncbi:MAG: hypothetical protein F4138_02070 [Acidimicrobiia bacterium]|nr:hypothetical protein [Acidimicrobiia bacterium]